MRAVFGTAASALALTLGMGAADTKPLSVDERDIIKRRPGGRAYHRFNGFDGELIRQMNRTNGVGSPSREKRAAIKEMKARGLV